MTWKGSVRLLVAVPVVLPPPPTALPCLAARPTAARAASPLALGIGCRATNCSATDEAARRYACLVWATAASHLEHVLSRTEPEPGFPWWVQCKKHHSFLVTWFFPFCFIFEKCKYLLYFNGSLYCMCVCMHESCSHEFRSSCVRQWRVGIEMQNAFGGWCPFEIYVKLGGLSLGVRVFTHEILWVICPVMGRKPLYSCMSISHALTYLCVYVCIYK